MSGSRTPRTPSFHPCKWATCRNNFFSTKEGLLVHLETHFKEPATRIRLSSTTPSTTITTTTTTAPSTRRNADQVGLHENDRPHKQPKVINTKDVAGEKSDTRTNAQTPARSSKEKTPVRTSPEKSASGGRVNSASSSSDRDARANTSPRTPKSTSRTSDPTSGKSLDRVFSSDSLSRALGSPTPRSRRNNASVTSSASIQALPSPKSHLANAKVRYPPPTLPTQAGSKSGTNARYSPSPSRNPASVNADRGYSSSAPKNSDSTNSDKSSRNAEVRYTASTSTRPDPTLSSSKPATSREPTPSGLGILFTPQTLSQIRDHEQTRKQASPTSRSPSIPSASTSDQLRSSQEDRSRSSSKPRHQESRTEKTTAPATQERVAEKSLENDGTLRGENTPHAAQLPSQQNSESGRQQEPKGASENQQDTTKNPPQRNPDRTAQIGVAQPASNPPHDHTTPAARPPVSHPPPLTSSNHADAGSSAERINALQKQQLQIQLMYQKQFVEEQMKESIAKQQQQARLLQNTLHPTNDHIQLAAQNTYLQNTRHNVPPAPQSSHIPSQLNLTVNTQQANNSQSPTIPVFPNSTIANGTTAASSDACDICHRQADSRVLVCDNCMTPYHESCHKPAPPRNLHIHDTWLCVKCFGTPIIAYSI